MGRWESGLLRWPYAVSRNGVAIPEDPAKFLRCSLWALRLNRYESAVSLGTMNLNALLSELALSFRVEIWTVKRMAVGGHGRKL
jgi:hypothetical protein